MFQSFCFFPFFIFTCTCVQIPCHLHACVCVHPTGAGMGGLLGYMFGRGNGGGGGYYRRPPHYGWNVGGGGSGWGSSPRSSWSSGGSHTTSGECHPTHSLPLLLVSRASRSTSGLGEKENWKIAFQRATSTWRK